MVFFHCYVNVYQRVWDVILPIDEFSIIFQYAYCTTNQMNIAVSLLLYCKYPFAEFNIANWNMAH